MDDDVTASPARDTPGPGWAPDVLGEGFEARPLGLPGGATATLVRHAPGGAAPDPAATAVLYVHGFVDYFFQVHVARAFAERGYAFYAVDLRGHGRSLAAWQDAGRDPNLVDELADYAADLDAATTAVRAAGHEHLVLLGHSTGGLVGALWAHARPGRLDALVLNSPWLDLNEPWFHRVVSTRVVDGLGRVVPRVVVGGLGEHYGAALHRGTGGEWDYDLAWKPHAGFPVRAGWFRTVRRGHARVARGLAVDCPVLVLASERSGPSRAFHDDLLTTDSVLDAEQIRRRAPRLGEDVTLVSVEGGAHDLALSPEPARTAYLTAVLDWLAVAAAPHR